VHRALTDDVRQPLDIDHRFTIGTFTRCGTIGLRSIGHSVTPFMFDAAGASQPRRFPFKWKSLRLTEDHQAVTGTTPARPFGDKYLDAEVLKLGLERPQPLNEELGFVRRRLGADRVTRLVVPECRALGKHVMRHPPADTLITAYEEVAPLSYDVLDARPRAVQPRESVPLEHLSVEHLLHFIPGPLHRGAFTNAVTDVGVLVEEMHHLRALFPTQLRRVYRDLHTTRSPSCLLLDCARRHTIPTQTSDDTFLPPCTTSRWCGTPGRRSSTRDNV